ncbi:MAG: GMC oxidoreductase [Methylophilaceae bacterium]
MLFDLNQFPVDTKPIEYDVCICGSGPAGITTALSLAKSGFKVALFEAGDLQYSEKSQHLYTGESIGQEFYNGLQTFRLRYFGGTSNHWSGRVAFFDPVDFEQRPSYFGLPGWPISYEEAYQHFDETCNILDVKNNFTKLQSKYTFDSKHFRLSEVVWSPPTRFNSKYLNALKQSKNIDLFLNANLTNIHLFDTKDSVKNFIVTNYNKTSFAFMSNFFVVALGGIENARMLLNCDSQFAKGIGNNSDFVGRCFMEHPQVEYGRFIVDNPKLWSSNLIDITTSANFMKKNNLGSGIVTFTRNTGLETFGRLKVLKAKLINMLCISTNVTKLARKVKDFNCDGDGTVFSQLEQRPNPRSRVMIGDERDEFGLRKVVLDWQITEADFKDFQKIGMTAAQEFARLGFGRVQLKELLLNDITSIKPIGMFGHHLGTTRMSEDPRFGVVDRNSKVHGIQNLYIAGASVFPTGGNCNPTFTIVNLALRLAKHLASLKARQPT